MTLLTIAIPVALLVAGAALLAFIWAARTDQFEDLDTPPRRMLLEDAPLGTGSSASSALRAPGSSGMRTLARWLAPARGAAWWESVVILE